MTAQRLTRTTALGLLATVLATLILGPTPLAASAQSPVATGVNDFSFSSWHTDIYATIERGDFGGDVVRAEFTETITAEFPDFDQNRGIVRGIPVDMGGQTMRIEDVSVTDGDGNPVPYETEQEFGANDLVLVIGNEYVHGSTTYVIEYTLVNTLIERGDSSPYALFAPNLTPPQRSQSIDEFSAEVSLDPRLWDALQQQTSYDDSPGYDGLDANCYIGASFQNNYCDFSVEPGIDFVMITIDPVNLGDEDVTLDLRLDPSEVQLPNFLEKLTATQRLAFWLALGLLIVGIGLLVLLHRIRRPKPLMPIIPRYSSEISPLRAAVLLHGGRVPPDGPAFRAHVLDVAVRGGVQLEEDDQEKAKPLVRLRYAEPTEELPKQTQHFRHNVLNVKNEGDSTLLVQNSQKLATRWRSFANAAVKRVEEDGLTAVSRRVQWSKALVSVALWLYLAAVAFVIWQYAHVSEDLMWIPLCSTLLGVVALGAQLVVLTLNPRQLTESGREALTELYGVRDYLRLAEEDRLRALQGPETAERISGPGLDAATVLHVYERLLPFAVLFKMSKEWAQVIDLKYTEADTSPSYVSGHAAGIMWADQQLHTVTPSYSSPGSSDGSSYSGSSSSFSGGGSAGGGFGGGSVGGH
ncbi:DUF2207 family protein [Gulosibacter sp. ACHW.36C]|uniref:DUF2207 domain-containing protein n=1 Tax=Gulosibacter sediminis TaxID=1729695 RepID=A0ABY4MW83_9MICO|nr:DUF2207 domain-containing protein [Gulosibacter sediminis]UQN14688.1 DUF2207 domain-containing protein [Gulosibacter sediminis]